MYIFVLCVSGELRCYCNEPSCVSTGYMCKSQARQCYTAVEVHGDKTRATHGCLESLPTPQHGLCSGVVNHKESSKSSRQKQNLNLQPHPSKSNSIPRASRHSSKARSAGIQPRGIPNEDGNASVPREAPSSDSDASSGLGSSSATNHVKVNSSEDDNLLKPPDLESDRSLFNSVSTSTRLPSPASEIGSSNNAVLVPPDLTKSSSSSSLSSPSSLSSLPSSSSARYPLLICCGEDMCNYIENLDFSSIATLTRQANASLHKGNLVSVFITKVIHSLGQVF